ncbi:type II toxin-antitoxin system RelB/DinJ family antitoxin [Patescibacteria group bacterium]|nr:type II toxin-antitoxin system RelB/DinJ family antitoxin [Patescibacteria group bacterium]
MTTIQIRIDEQTKKKSAKILKSLGLDTSSAINAFLKQVILKKGIPFPLLTENGLTIEQEAEIQKAAEEAERGINIKGPFKTGKEAVAFLESLSKKTK